MAEPNQDALDGFAGVPRVAYFTMEIALRPEIPSYSGGLGVLAGDTIRSCADLDLRMVAVSLVSRRGYFRQEIDAAGRQIEHPQPWEPALWAKPVEAKITVPVEGRAVWVGGWLYTVEGSGGGAQPVLLLDTDLDENAAEDRELAHHLYGREEAYRLKQEIVLGIGGVRLLHALGFRVSHYHMNEGHSALLALELLRRHAWPREELPVGESPYNVALVREMCSFTTHTPVEAGHDKFPWPLVARVLGGYVEEEVLRRLGGREELNMTRLALNLSETVNGVAKSHAEQSRRMFPDYQVHSITNGVHPCWTSEPFARLYDERLPGWRHEPELLVRADCCLAPEAVWAAHAEARLLLIDEVKARCGLILDTALPILGFARRMTAYKRPLLLFSDLERLRAIARRTPFQIVMAGKAHPRDEEGKRQIGEIHRLMRELRDEIPIAFLPDYGMAAARLLVAGVDVWLNTPLRPREASGTSGMKAAFNGVPSLSVLDGWWREGCIENVTGWAVGGLEIGENGTDAASLYDKLERVVLPLFADRPAWIRVMQGAIAKNASYFNSHRMMRRYVTETYIR